MDEDPPINPNPNPTAGAGGDEVPAAPRTMREYLQLHARVEPVVEETDAARTARLARIMPPAGARPPNIVDLMYASPEYAQFCNLVKKIDGEHYYINERIALGRLSEAEYLILPSDLAHPTIPDDEVGTNKAENHFSKDYLWGVYVLNKSLIQDPSNDNDVKFGLARMEAVKLGWWKGLPETKWLPIPADFHHTVAADGEKIRYYLAAARDAAWLVPFANEHIFRTKGHHYITGHGNDYNLTGCYEAIFRAALKPEMSGYLPANVIYHKAFHWISPARTWTILTLNRDSNLIPDAIKVRMSYGPAGTAIVTTSAAVLRSMSIQYSGMYDKLTKANHSGIDGILALDLKIRANPTKYHRFPTAYGMSLLAGDDLEELNRMKEEAEKFGPIGKAFCDVMLKYHPLGEQKVLNKASQANPIVYQKAKRFFIGIQRETTKRAEEGVARKSKSDGPPMGIDD